MNRTCRSSTIGRTGTSRWHQSPRSRACRRSWGTRGTGRACRPSASRARAHLRRSAPRSRGPPRAAGPPGTSGLDAQPGQRAAEGDGLQLRHHERHQAVRQRGVDQVLVRRHAADVGGAGPGSTENTRSRPDVEPGPGPALAGRKRLGPLGQPHGVAGGMTSLCSRRPTRRRACSCAPMQAILNLMVKPTREGRLARLVAPDNVTCGWHS